MRSVKVAVALAALGVVGTPTTARADAPGPTDWEARIVSIDPASDAIDVSIVGGDSFVSVDVEPDHELVVLGYDGEHYLRVLTDGTVERNRRSYATYYNEERFGGDDIPDIVDHDALPDWERVGDGGRWAWHDHRIHWMDEEPPLGLLPGESLPTAEIPLLVDGTPTTVAVVTTLQPTPAAWPVAIGVFVGIGLIAWGGLGRLRAASRAVAAMAAAALVVGAVQYASVPGETGPSVRWWLQPLVGLVAGLVAVWLARRAPLIASAATALAGLQLAVWAWQRRGVFLAAILPTDLPAWIDRTVTGIALTGGAGLLVVAVAEMFRRPHPPQRTVCV